MKLFRGLVLFGLGLTAMAQTQKQEKPATKPTGSASSQTASASERPTAEDVMKLLRLMGIQDGLQITLDTMKEQMKGGADQALQEKIAEPTPEQLKAGHVIVDEEFKKLSLDSMILDIIPVYQRHFTRTDVEQLLAFYGSQVGKKIVHEQPIMLKESMQATQAAQRKKMEALLAAIDQRIQQLITEEQKKTVPAKK